MASPSQVKAVNKYIKNHTRRYTLQCNKETEADIIEFLDSAPNYNKLLKEIIREKMSEK